MGQDKNATYINIRKLTVILAAKINRLYLLNLYLREQKSEDVQGVPKKIPLSFDFGIEK